MTIYLYLKQHNTTGLKYFGKTEQNPYTYTGSGVYWLRHLKKHGRDISTINVWEFDNQEHCTEFAMKYSNEFNIVQSNEYANLVEERGYDGCAMRGEQNGMYGKTHTPEARNKISEARKSAPTDAYRGKRNAMYGKIGELNPFFGKFHSDETKQKMRKPRSVARPVVYCIYCHRGISVNAFGQHLKGKKCSN